MSTSEVLLKIVLPVVIAGVVALVWWAGKAMLEGAREGIQEAREEEAQARAERDAARAAADAAQQVRLQQLAGQLSAFDRYALSLRAVFAEVWIQDVFPKPDERPYWDYFFTVQPPEGQLGEFENTLKDGWDITDHASAMETLAWLLGEGHRADYTRVQAALLEQGVLDSPDRKRAAQALGPDLAREAGVVLKWQAQVGEAGGAAFDSARAVDVAGQALALGYLTEAEAWRVIRHCGVHARTTFSSWEAFGRSFQAGAEFWQSGGLVNKVRHGRYAKSVEWLLSDPRSPWLQVLWGPQDTEAPATLN